MSLPNTVIIAHGASEIILCRRLSSLIKTPVEIYSRSRGEETIALSHLQELLSNSPFDSEKSLHKQYPRLEYRTGKVRMPNLTIIPVVDVDGDGRSIKSYLSGDMFNDSLFRDRIIPVLNNPNLEEVMYDIGYPQIIDKTQSYSKMDLDPILLHSKLKSSDKTNMELLLEKMMSHSPSFQ